MTQKRFRQWIRTTSAPMFHVKRPDSPNPTFPE